METQCINVTILADPLFKTDSKYKKMLNLATTFAGILQSAKLELETV